MKKRIKIKKLTVDLSFDDLPTIEEDKERGNEIAKVIGDTFINFHEIPPNEQWTIICKILRIHELKIIENSEKMKCLHNKKINCPLKGNEDGAYCILCRRFGYR